jgi:hypothetical protein
MLAGNRFGQVTLLPVILALAVLLSLLILRSKKFWQQLTPYLNGIFAILVLMPLWTVIDFHRNEAPASATALVNPYERVVSTPTVNNSPERPDVYYIILDGYSSNSLWMEGYGYDNSDFTDALAARGFYVALDSQSNYGATLLSIPSALNMRYITGADKNVARPHNIIDYMYLRSLISNSRVADEFKQQGYTYIQMLSGFLPVSVLADENVVFYPDGPQYLSGSELVPGPEGIPITWSYKQPFWPFFLETTLLRPFASDLVVADSDSPLQRYSRKTFWDTLAELERVAEREEATFTFAHITKPHYPIQFDREGNPINDVDDDDPNKPEIFFDQLHYLNTQLLDLVDHILAESTVPPIIILQGDHGSDLGSFIKGSCLYPFEILNAYYLPDGGAEMLFPDIQPVNSFRVILNYYFGADYDLLAPEQYIVPNKCEYIDLLTVVPYQVSGRLNVDLGDHIALIYNGTGANGDPEFHIFEVTDSGEKGDLLLAITYEEIEPYLATLPEENTVLVQQGAVRLSILTSGELQFNIGPDDEGREWAMIMNGLPAKIVYGYEVGVE